MFLVTGAAGFLGRQVVEGLLAQGGQVRALVLPGDPLASLLPAEVEICEGDLLNMQDLERFFEGDSQKTLIHCASLISMSMKMVDKVYQVNVQGTANLIACCKKTGSRLLHVASVHAIKEKEGSQVMAEPDKMEPDQVVGCYAQTKAQAVALVMEARQQGLEASVVYPAGLSGPGDYARGNLTQLFLDYLKGSITMGVRGGYNFADVRDVAQAIVTLARSEKMGEDYVLAGEYISVMDILNTFQQASGGKRITKKVPIWLAKLFLPLIGLMYKIRKVKPVFSTYSLYTVGANSHFDSSKAERDLGYAPRPIRQTLTDTANWLMAQKFTLPFLKKPIKAVRAEK